jgi:ABC-type transport system involved in cytochrome c biogenesis permease subunit
VSKDVESRQRGGKTPMTFSHAVAMTAVGVVGILIAFWILSSVAGIILFFVKVAVIIAAIAGVFWLVSRLRR